MVNSKSPRQVRKLVIAAVIGVIAVAGWFGWQAFMAARDQRAADDSVYLSIRAAISRDWRTLEKYQFGDELDKVGLTRKELDTYMKHLMDGYIDKDAKITVQRTPLNLREAQSDYERNMQAQILEARKTSPEYEVTIERADDKPPLNIVVYAMRSHDGWVVSPVATLAWLQGRYSQDPKVKYARIRDSLEKTGVDGICWPSGGWITIASVNEYLAGKRDEIGIFVHK